MKSKVVILVILLIGFTSSAQSEIEESDYILKGKLINGFDGITPLCGVFAWATIVEFEIIEFSDSKYTGKEIPIIFACPNSNHSNLFKVGNIYNIILTKKKDLSNWTFREEKLEILSKYDLSNEYWFVEN
ncbi:MAG: hypothetical protein ACTHOM_09905 [Allomuricauda sp.]